MEDDKLAADEARRVAQHGAMKSQVEADVTEDIAEQAEHVSAAESLRLRNVASVFKGKAIDEVVSTDREVTRGRGLARVAQVVDYLFVLLYGLLAIRLVLALIAARASSGFVQFINVVTAPFYALFKGIVSSPSAEGSTLAMPIVVALAAWAMLHAAIKGLLRLVATRTTEI